jgi:hypothetical protein
MTSLPQTPNRENDKIAQMVQSLWFENGRDGLYLAVSNELSVISFQFLMI